MKNDTTSGEAKGFAEQHPRYSALCTLPDGRVITTAAAEAQGYLIRTTLAPEPPKASPRRLPAPLAAVPPRPVVMPVPAAVVADRARMTAIIDATPPGAEAERDEAIRTGASVEEFRRSLGAFTILRAMGASRGR